MSTQQTDHHGHQTAHHAGPDGQQPEPVLRPPAHTPERDSGDAALDLIRQKLQAIYADEPDAKQELAEVNAQPIPQQSRHQQYMAQLQASGVSADQLQAQWHAYYQNLDDQGKREVWQEFYSQSSRPQQQSRLQPQVHVQEHAKETVSAIAEQDTGHTDTIARDPQPSAAAYNPTNPLYGSNQTTMDQPATMPIEAEHPNDTADTIRQQLRSHVAGRSKLQAKHHLQSLAFGLGVGGLTIVIVLFSFFNEIIIAPFIQPSRTVSATPIIVSPDGITASDKNEVLIPKINVEIPLDFSATSTEEKAFDAALDKGVAHYPTTVLPGQKGNAAFFGHSSNNIFNPGKYKFAFLMLNELTPGDMFYITYDKTVYSYQVYDKKIVEATQVDILDPVRDKQATALLVTCDPPGTSLRRLAVWAEQISPNPNANVAASAQPKASGQSTESLPGNGPTLWKRFTDLF